MASPTAHAQELTVAEVLRDLGDLFVAEPDAALALITANRRPSTSPRTTSKTSLKSLPDSAPSDRPVSSTRTTIGTSSNPTATELLSQQGSLQLATGMPVGKDDPDMERAKTLLGLWEVRSRGELQENMGLERARASVGTVERKYRKLDEQLKWDGRGRKDTAD